MKRGKYKAFYINESKDKIMIADCIKVSNTFFARFLGLMGRRLKPGQGMLLYPCKSVHTFFMLQPIDVVYLDRNWNIVKVVNNMKPWSVDSGHRDAYYTLELPANKACFEKGQIDLTAE
jgi:uncharacterized membrane protein (UPF0127 family)